MNDFILNEWLEYARRVANSFAGTYKRVEAEDIYQELAIELITKEKQLTAAFETMEKPGSYTKVILKNCATRFCMSQKNAFFVQTDIYDYQTADVRTMLEQYFGGRRDGMFVPDDAKSVHGDDDLAIFGDIARVVEELSETDLETLENYLFSSEAKETAERQAYSRVVRKVTNALNHSKKKAIIEYEGTGSRKVMTNLQSMAVTRTGYNMREKDFA